MSVHDLLDWLLGRGQYQPQESVQDTGAYQLPDLLGKVAGGKRWNGPVGTWASVYRNEPPHRRRGDTPIPATRETGEMPQLPMPSVMRSPQTINSPDDVPTGPTMPGLPRWLVASVPGGRDLPVLRQQVVNPAPSSRQIAANTGAIDDMLMTLGSARDRYHLDLPALQDLPTVPSQDKMVSDALNALPPPAPLPDTVVEAFAADAFLLAPPVLQEMDEDATASADKISNPLGVTVADMQPDLSVTEPTELSRKVRDQRAIEQLLNETKESEG